MLALFGCIAAIGIAAGAYAYFTSTGSGTGSATVGSSTPFTVAFTATTGGPVFPDSGTATVHYTVTNPSGAGAQKLSGTAASVAASSGNITEGGTPVSGCLAAWFTATNSGPAAGVLAPGQSASGTVAVTMQDSGTSQDPCQGKTPDITVTAS